MYLRDRAGITAEKECDRFASSAAAAFTILPGRRFRGGAIPGFRRVFVVQPEYQRDDLLRRYRKIFPHTDLLCGTGTLRN